LALRTCAGRLQKRTPRGLKPLWITGGRYLIGTTESRALPKPLRATQIDMRTAAKCQVLIADCFFIVNRRELAQTGNGCGNQAEGKVHFFFRILLAQAEAQAGAGAVRRESHRGQHM
jgi:hypothetical protein